MEKKTYYLTNGYAQGYDFESTYEDAVKSAEESSRYMNTANWLHVYDENGKSIELGRTHKRGPRDWRFESYNTQN